MEFLKSLCEWLGKVGKMIGMTEPRQLATTRQIVETIKFGLGLERESLPRQTVYGPKWI
jgi:hypothetical protein